MLSTIANSTRALSSTSAGPAEIAFTPDGDQLIVTEKNTNIISTYSVGFTGVAAAGHFTPSSGQTPFGFSFRDDMLIVSEAFGGGVNASAVSSYRETRGGALAVVSGTVKNTETAACWIAVTRNGRFAYAANTGSGTISGYAVNARGALSLLDANGQTAVLAAATAPADMAMSQNSRFLYVRNGGNGTINAMRVHVDGSLTVIGTITNLPTGTAGLVAR